MATTKLVAHQYVCIRALEAILAQMNKEFGAPVTYRVTCVDLPEVAHNGRQHTIKGRLLSFPTSEGLTEGKFKGSFSCSIRLYKSFVKRLGLWIPSDFEFFVADDKYTGYIFITDTRGFEVRSIRKMIRPS